MPAPTATSKNSGSRHDMSVILVTGSYDHEIRFWEAWSGICSRTIARTGESGLITFEGHSRNVTSVSFHSEGKWLVTGSEDGTIKIWDLRCLATCSADTTVAIWSISPNYEFKLERSLIGHQRWVWDCAFSADSAYLVTASSDHTARLWEMASGETVRQYNGHHKAAVCCALHDGAG
ncbi:hypothetical protein HHX47_DHR1001000 [Lentinula edodes]|nr:hypothetical protein HHX47_DHR1001000 [Lentinula edodes]